MPGVKFGTLLYGWILVFVVFLSSSVGMAQTEKKLNANPEYWKSKIQSNPKNAVGYFNLGVVYYQRGKVKSAIVQFKKVVKLKSQLAPVAYYYMSLIYKEKGHIETAKKLVEKVNVSEVPQNLRKRVLLFKNSLYLEEVPKEEEEEVVEEVQEQEKRYSLYAEYSYGSNDNPAYEEDPDDDDVQSKITAVLGYSLFQSDRAEIKLSYTYGQTDYGDNTDSETSYHDLTLPLAWYLDSLRVRLIPEYMKDTYGGEDYSTSYGSAADVSYKMENYYFTVYYQSMKLSPEDMETYSYLEGKSQKFKVSAKRQGEIYYATFGLSYVDYDYEDTDSVTSSYKAPSAALTVGLYFGDFDITAYSSYEKKVYSEDSSGDIREDEVSSYSLQVGYAAHRYVRVFTEAATAKNTSSDSDNDYDQTTLILGLSSGL
jgi:tetratricopeptide (TPR) repeat protein